MQAFCRFSFIMLIGAAFCAFSPNPVYAQATAPRPRIIVDPFDYSTVRTIAAQVFGTDMDVGRGIQAMMVKRITDEGKLVVVERSKLQQITSEQDLNASNRVQQGTGAKVGAIHGADLIIAGDIVTFGRDDKRQTVAGGGLLGGVLGGIADARRTDKAVVAIDYRVIDAQTSEVVASGEARGESTRKSKAVGGFLAGFAGGAGVQVDMTSTGFAQTIIGEATMDCINKLAAILDAQAAKMPERHNDIDGRVAYVNGNTIAINEGAGAGVHVGDHFQISHITGEIDDPVTHKPLDISTVKIGVMVVNSVRPNIAMGTFTGTDTPKIGDDAASQ